MSWFKVHRGWRDCEIFGDEPMSEREAWLWLIENAAWKPTTRRNAKGETIKVDTGQLHASLRSLGTAFGWGKNRVSRFLDRLGDEKMIRQSSGQSGLLITICNYEIYQGKDEPRGTVSGTAAGQPRDTQEEYKEVITIPNGMGVPPDPAKQLFDLGVEVLMASGQTQAAARSIVGRWRKNHSDGAVVQALIECRAKAISNPVEWIPKRLGSPQQDAGYDRDFIRKRYAGARA